MGQDLDLSYLYEITGSDSEIIIEMLELFMSETPKQIANIKESVGAGDWIQIKAEAHKLKTNFIYVGLVELNEMTIEIEKLAKEQSDMERIVQIVKKLEDGFTESLPSLDNELKRFSG
ncbi:MAG: Hpt domain-containing protein [Balneolaceae bacterium]